MRSFPFGGAFCAVLLLASAAAAATNAPASRPAATNHPPPAQGAITNAPARPAADTNAPAATPAAPATEAAQRASLYGDVEVLTEALMLIRRHYVQERSYQEIVSGAIHGMLQSLDPHSVYLEPQVLGYVKEDTEGHFGGIGIHIGMLGGFPLVVSPIEDSPAYRAGLMSGDRIVAIEGRSTAGFNIEQAMKKLRGPSGSTVKLTIAREGEDAFDVQIVRDDIRPPTVKGPRMLRGNVACIRLTQFSEPTAEAFSAAMDRMVTQRVEGFVLDLRDNPGGLLNVAVAVAERLLPAGAPIVSTRGRAGVREGIEFRAGGRRHLANLPMAVLVNEGSASASEIVAGALQDHHRAVVVGERSYGKASVQNIVPLATRTNCAIKLTTAYYYTPAGRLIHDKGIEPDIAVPMSPREWRRAQLRRTYEEMPEAYPVKSRENVSDAVDTQLERAVDALIAARALSPERKN
jgi:carboxyl-terminal processing protease